MAGSLQRPGASTGRRCAGSALTCYTGPLRCPVFPGIADPVIPRPWTLVVVESRKGRSVVARGTEVARTGRWLITTAGAGAVFAVCLVAAWADPLEWLPADEGDHWTVATAFAGAIAAVAGAGLGWWAGQEDPAAPGHARPPGRVRQRAKAGRGGHVVQIGGSRGGRGRRTVGDVDQRAGVRGGESTQIGGDDLDSGGRP